MQRVSNRSGMQQDCCVPTSRALVRVPTPRLGLGLHLPRPDHRDVAVPGCSLLYRPAAQRRRCLTKLPSVQPCGLTFRSPVNDRRAPPCRAGPTVLEREAATDSRNIGDGVFSVTTRDLKAIGERPPDEPRFDGPVWSTEELATALHTSLTTGLHTDEADFQTRRVRFGRNRLAERTKSTFWEFVKDALKDFTVQILLVAGLLSYVLGLTLEGGDGWIEGAAIMAAVAVVVLVTAVNDFQKEKQFQELNSVNKDIPVRVTRDGFDQTISTYDLLVGDVMLVTAGDIVEADGILFEGNALRVDESHLTGESEDVMKQPVDAAMMYSGSKVLEGFGRVLVTAVGVNSQQGLISDLVAGASETKDGLRETTQLQQKLEVMAGDIGKIGLTAALISLSTLSIQFSYNTFVDQHQPWSWSYLTEYLHFLIQSITVLVVAVPEGLPLAVTIALAYSVKRMLSENNLVRHLGAAETMGCATTICTDKTGTLTQNDMEVVRLWLGGKEYRDLSSLPTSASASTSDSASGNGAAASASTSCRSWNPLGIDPRVHSLFCAGMSLNSTASLEPTEDSPDGFVKVGNRTECALLELVRKLGADSNQIRKENEILRVFPFSSDRKRMSTITFQTGSSLDGVMCARLHLKGAAEIVMEHCATRIGPDSSVTNFADGEKEKLLDSFSRDGCRMLALAYRDVFIPYQSDENADAFDAAQLETGLTLLAVLGIEDPIRAEVPAAIEQCQRAGITVRMLTGDNATTARSIARQCSILPPLASSSILATRTLALGTWDERSLEEVLQEGTAPATASLSGTMEGLSSRRGHMDATSTWTGSMDERWTGDGAPSSSAASSSGNADGSSAMSVAAEMGLAVIDGPGSGEVGVDQTGYLVLDGPEFRRLVLDPDGNIQQHVFDKLWPHLRVLARCSPSDKYLIVQGLQANPKEVVAMTGDGTNDAPALRLADIGFAMNSGTSIAKEASDILLMDDNFTSVVSAVKWGRNVYAGITKFLQFQLTINAVAIITACGGAIVLQESPLTAVQMLWVNLIMDSLASLSLATEEPTDEMLDLPPYATDQPLLTLTIWKSIAGQAVFQLGVMYALVFHGDTIFNVPAHISVDGPSQHYTIAFNTFVLMQLVNQINARKIHDEPNVFSGILENKLFLAVLGGEALLQVLIVQFGGEAFATTPLSLQQWGACMGFAALGLFVRAGLLPFKMGFSSRASQP